MLPNANSLDLIFNINIAAKNNLRIIKLYKPISTLNKLEKWIFFLLKFQKYKTVKNNKLFLNAKKLKLKIRFNKI